MMTSKQASFLPIYIPMRILSFKNGIRVVSNEKKYINYHWNNFYSGTLFFFENYTARLQKCNDGNGNITKIGNLP